ncbi:hypothetical protein GYB59_21270 [bacterium]|nr:hypothetical protein [bacterium]
MRKQETDTSKPRCYDKQLQAISLDAVLEKRRMDQALNVKEFAVCAGVSYSTARSWFRLPGFPAFQGVVFWQDFVSWRMKQNSQTDDLRAEEMGTAPSCSSDLPPRAARILSEAKNSEFSTKH